MQEKVVILDFGSQYTQLIGRRVRELNVYCEIYPFNALPVDDPSIKAVILSGSPFSVLDPNSLDLDLDLILGKYPILAICYGAQLIAKKLGGEVARSTHREYGRARLKPLEHSGILRDIEYGSQVWMSHGDSILQIPDHFQVYAETESIPVAVFVSDDGHYDHPVYCLQFHPEVHHTVQGPDILSNFLFEVVGVTADWTPESFIEEQVRMVRDTLGSNRIVMGLSGGVDSTVAAKIIDRAVDDQLYCVFIDNGLLRKGEYEQVLKTYESVGLQVIGVDAKQRFWDALSGVSDPEKKRKVIGREFIELFQEEASRISGVQWLGQGTIYPDVIESVSVHGPSVTIKSHHNVGGLPEKMHLKIIEPLKMLFKDEVRRVGRTLGLPDLVLGRHPFPGPGLAIRILGDVTEERVRLLQQADSIFIDALKDHGLYEDVWQAGAILLPVHSVGVMGDERTYEQVIALRAVGSTDGMTAEWSRLPYDFLEKVSTDIINKVQGINRVVYDISTKPPATIEWE